MVSIWAKTRKADATQRSRAMQLFRRVELEKMARKISHVMRDEITALLPQKKSKNRQKYHSTDDNRYIKIICCNRLITVLEAILSGRQPLEKIQCLYNLTSSIFAKTAVLKKINCNLRLHTKGFYWQNLRALLALNSPERTAEPFQIEIDVLNWFKRRKFHALRACSMTVFRNKNKLNLL